MIDYKNKENILTLVVLTIVVLFVFSQSFYDDDTVPTQSSQNILKQRAECKELTDRFIKNGNIPHEGAYDVESGYIPSLETCAVRYSIELLGDTAYIVKDIFSEKTILYWESTQGAELCDNSTIDYECTRSRTEFDQRWVDLAGLKTR